MQTKSKFILLGILSALSILVNVFIVFESVGVTQMLLAGGLAVTLVAISLVFAYQYSEESRRLHRALMSAAESKDLSQRIPALKQKELNQIGELINKMLDHLSITIDRINKNTETLFESGAQIAATSSHVTVASDQQLTSANDVENAMTDLSGGITQIAENVSEVRVATGEANDLCQDGDKAIEKLVRDINNIDDSFSAIRKLIESLSLRSNEIVGIIDVITSIAEQTNLLALNAAIEAARAGEQGRGFAVVADEVRGLAQRTHEATSQVTEMVFSINNETSDVVDKMNDSQEKVSLCVEEANGASEILTKIFNHSSQIETRVNEISLTIDDQNNTAVGVVDKVKVICGLSIETNDEIHKSNHAIYGMLSEAITLASTAREYSSVERNELNELLSAISQIRMNAVLTSNVINVQDTIEPINNIQQLDEKIDLLWKQFKSKKSYSERKLLSDQFWEAWNEFVKSRSVTLSRAKSGDFNGSRKNAVEAAGPRFKAARKLLVELINMV